jgi:hypothetical protein
MYIPCLIKPTEKLMVEEPVGYKNPEDWMRDGGSPGFAIAFYQNMNLIQTFCGLEK